MVSRTAQHYSAACADNVRAVFPLLDQMGQTAVGRTALQKNFMLCALPDTAYKVSMLKYFVRDAFDTM